MKRSIFYTAFIAVAFTLLTGAAQAATFTGGNLAVCRVGTGAAALNGNATAVFIDEYTPAGGLVQSIAMPVADDGPNQILTASGTATSECFITRSQNARYLVITGYDAAVGTASVASSSTTGGTPIVRVIGSIDADGVVNTSTTTTSFSGAGIRSAATNDATQFWAVGANTGVVFQPLAGTGAGTIVSTTFTNIRTAGVFGDQLYTAAGASTLRLGAVGTGLPTTTGNTTVNLAGLPTTGVAFNGFFMADLSPVEPGIDTIYVADDQAAGTGGIRKYTLAAGTWTASGITANALYRGLAGSVGVGGAVTLFATRGAAGNEIVTLTDTSGYGGTLAGTPSNVVTATTNTAFRGIAFAPLSPTSATASISGRVTTANGRGIPNVYVTISGGELTEPRSMTTGSFGYYTFDDLPTGGAYVVSVGTKRYTFSNSSRLITLLENLTDADFAADPQE